MLSRSDIRTGCYDILRENEQDASSYPISLMNDFINNYYFNALTIGVLNIFTNVMIKKTCLPFNESEAFYNIPAIKTLADDLYIGDTSISILTDGLKNAGKIIIDGNIITYTSKTPDTLEGVTGIKGNFNGGTIVQQLYDLPTDFSSVIEATNNGYPIEIENYNEISKKRLEKIYNASGNYITIIQGRYLLIHIGNQGTNLLFKYNQKPSLLLLDTDEITIPDDIYGMMIKYLAVGEMMYNRGEEVRGKEVFLYGITKLIEFYEFYNNQVSNDLNGTRIKSGRFNPYNF